MQDQSKSITLREVVDVVKSAGLFITVRHLSVDDHSLLIDYPATDTRELEGEGARERGSEKSRKRVSEGRRAIRSFICIKGSKFDGHRFIKQAIEKGIQLIITELVSTEEPIRQIVVSDTRKALAVLAALYLQDPAKDLFLIGVTGTNGKTSIVKIMENIMLKQGLSVGTIGTLGYSINGKHYSLERTTPDITELNEILYKMRQMKIRFVVMEVSSHALKLDRVYGLKYNMAIFTNLTREHLDFHNDMEDYYQSKKKLFSQLSENDGVALINKDDPYGKRLYDEFIGKKYYISEQSDGEILYRVEKRSLIETIFNLKFNSSFYTSSMKKDKNSQIVITHLLGKHNAFNITAAVAALRLAVPELNMDSITASLPNSIKGRLQKVVNEHNISCYIDFAHTPDALKTVCSTLNSILQEKNCNLSEFETKGRLITVIGAGGDRDKGKRREMTDAIMQYSDHVIVTSDNPRSENPIEIIIDMIGHLHPLANYWIVVDRRKAIETAINIINEKDILLIAGKGHENYQELSSGKIDFDDYLVSQEAIKEKYDVPLRYNRGNHFSVAASELDEVHSACCITQCDFKNEQDNYTYDSYATTHSPASIRLSIPLDLIQVRILLEANVDFDYYLAWQQRNNKKGIISDNRSRIELLRKRGLTQHGQIFCNISTDTRTINNDSLFFALKGENYDGHKYISEALKLKNNWAVIDEKIDLKGKGDTIDHERIIRVSNTKDAYSILAKKYRSLFNLPVVAITGSSGKTTTKEYCFNILSSRSQLVMKNFANENNILGVSKTLFRLSSNQHYAIIEVGSNHFGEIQKLADICEPEVAMITNIGPSHLEFLRDLDGVFREKSALLKRDLWFALIPLNDPRFADLTGNNYRIGFEEDVVERNKCHLIKIVELSKSKSKIEIDGESYSIPTDLKFNILNAAYAIVLAKKFGYNTDDIQTGLSSPLSLKDRMEIYYEGEHLIISDCYNANPVSMKLAIDYWLNSEQEKPHIAILGDMLELGDDSEQYHLDIARYISEKSRDLQIAPQIISVGKWSNLFAGQRHFNDVEELISSDLLSSFKKKAVILIKASHGIHLEKIKGRL